MPKSKQVRGSVPLSPGLFARLEALASLSRRTVRDLVEQAVEREFGLVESSQGPFEDPVVEARLRLIDRLARLEAGAGDPDELIEEVRFESRRLRESGVPSARR